MARLLHLLLAVTCLPILAVRQLTAHSLEAHAAGLEALAKANVTRTEDELSGGKCCICRKKSVMFIPIPGTGCAGKWGPTKSCGPNCESPSIRYKCVPRGFVC
ncbi:unnamed protein product [Effrenium voratum]|nr:unnamed protein product [Effrenium voratum]